MRRIVVLQTAFLGDVVLTTPLLREIRRARPDTWLQVVATPGGAELLTGIPAISEIVRFDKKGRDRGLRGTWNLGARLKREGPDVVIAAQRSSRTGILSRASGAPVRVGFAGAAGAWAYNHKVRWNPSSHAVHRYLALSAPAGGDPETADARPALVVQPTAADRVTALLGEDGVTPGTPLLAIAPGSIWGTKRWTPEGFAEVARWGVRRGLRPVLVGSAAEAPLCRRVAELASGDSVVLAGRAGIADLVALASRARAMVTNDSGPGHVAAAVGTPVLVIFGPTVPEFGYAPFGDASRIVGHPDLPCRPCDRHGPAECPLEHHRCMTDLAPDTVLSALQELLDA